jgi:hypothetical protein
MSENFLHGHWVGIKKVRSSHSKNDVNDQRGEPVKAEVDMLDEELE